MKALLKYSIVLALGLAAGIFVQQAELTDPATFQQWLGLDWLDKTTGSAGDSSPFRGPPGAVAPVDGDGAASDDEEQDYELARRLGSREAWRTFLGRHGSGAHAQSARAELESLQFAGITSAPPTEEASRRPPQSDANNEIAAAPPSAGIGAAALTSEEACKADEKRLARLRSHPSFDEAERFAGELNCEKLWPQLLAVVETLGPAAGAPAVSNGVAPEVKPVGEAAPSDSSSDAPEADAPAADEICRRDADRLARLRGNPSADEAVRFSNELRCEQLRPQLLTMMESLSSGAPPPVPGDAAKEPPAESQSVGEAAIPAPTAGAASSAAAVEPKIAAGAASEAPASAETAAAAPAPNDVCARDADRLARLRSDPSPEEAGRFAGELGCEKLRPQLQRLIESLGPAPHALIASANPPRSIEPPADAASSEACTKERAALDRLREQPSAEAARLFRSGLRCEDLRPQVRLLLESLDVAPDSSGSNDGATQPARGARATHRRETADSDDCRRETAELDRIRAAPDPRDAKRFATSMTCAALKPQAARLLESLGE